MGPLGANVAMLILKRYRKHCELHYESRKQRNKTVSTAVSIQDSRVRLVYSRVLPNERVIKVRG